MSFSSKFSKREYKAMACALAIATSFSAGTLSAYAADGATAENAAVETVTSRAAAPTTRQSQWDSSKPSDDAITKEIQQVAGKSIMAIEFSGISDDIIKTAEASLATKIGDKLTIDKLTTDANNIYATGYFYDLYPSFREIPEGVVVTYHAFETPMISDVEIKGNSEIEKTDDLKKVMQLKPGMRLNRNALKEDVAAIQKKYVGDGFVMAKIHDMAVGDEGKIVIEINEGILEGYKIKGLKKTKEKVILRELRTKVGKPLNKKDVVRSYQRITNLGFFETVDVKPIPGVEPNACILEVDVTEKNTGTFGIGAGFSSSDGLVGMINVGDSNFRGIGDAINVVYTVSGDSTDARGWSFSYRRPWLDKKQTAGVIRLYNRTYEYNDYNTDGSLVEEFMRKASGFELGLSRPQSEYSSNSIGIRNRNDGYEFHEGGDINRSTDAFKDWRRDNFGLTRSISFFHTTDTRDNVMYPTGGHRVSLGFEWAGWGGDFSYQKYTIDDGIYRKIGRNQILCFHTSYGHASKNLSEFSKFRIGGQDTIRGYRDEQFRGNSMFIETIEFRFPLGSKLKGALFTDNGAAWDGGWIPKNFHSSVGVGFMLDTPVGPIRIDIGHGSQGNRVHFNMGTNF